VSQPNGNSRHIRLRHAERAGSEAGRRRRHCFPAPRTTGDATASAVSIDLAWTNTAANATGFVIERKYERHRVGARHGGCDVRLLRHHGRPLKTATTYRGQQTKHGGNVSKSSSQLQPQSRRAIRGAIRIDATRRSLARLIGGTTPRERPTDCSQGRARRHRVRTNRPRRPARSRPISTRPSPGPDEFTSTVLAAPELGRCIRHSDRPLPRHRRQTRRRGRHPD